MTLNNFLEAVAENLSACGRIDTYSSMKFRRILTGISSSELSKRHRKKLDRRRRRHVQIEVLYFLASKDNLDFNEWSEKMLDEFESLTVVETESRSRLVRLTNVTARKDDDSRVYQFLF